MASAYLDFFNMIFVWDASMCVPSIDEENGLVTCGNAILGGSNLKYHEPEIKIKGIQNIQQPYTT